MEIKTSDSYQRDVLAKYKNEKGGEMSVYLTQPTPSQIKEACLALLEKRKSKNDQKILNRFFQFENEENRSREIQNFDGDKFKPIVNFLKGGVKKTRVKNIELISWLIDFEPRPCQEYLKTDNLDSEVNDSKPEIEHEPEGSDINNADKLEEKIELERKKLEETKRKEEKKRRRRIITISIGLAFGMTMLILGIQNWPLNILKSNSNVRECMTWANSHYVTVSCDTGPLSMFGTEVKPLRVAEFENMQKVKVTAAYDFFTEEGKPRIWYYKNKDGGHEYFTAPGLHPTNGETLRKITPYIIQTYVPKHRNKKSSFVQ